MSEWYGLRPTVVSERTAPTRPDERTAPESEVEAPPTEEPAAEE